MKLSHIASGMPFAFWGRGADPDIAGIAIDSRKIEKGYLFVCLMGGRDDGHAFINQAAERGAVAVLCEYVPDGAPAGLVYMVTGDTRAALAAALNNFYKNPGERLRIAGVTGTKGKTSVTYYLKHILESSGERTGLIGTTGAYIGGVPTGVEYLTSSTPDAPELYKILAAIADGGAGYAVMEVTSHGLLQRRAEGLGFEIGIFTNLSHDHLDYHKSMENYLRAKALLFRQSKLALINADDPYASKLMESLTVPVRFYGINSGETGRGPGYWAENTRLLPGGVQFDVAAGGKLYPFKLNVPGRFSVYNALAAIAAALELGFSPEAAAKGVESIAGVPGRFEKLENGNDICVIVDYAHTPDSLQNIISAVREFTKERVITLFGCGGDRDREKRPVMGEVAGRLSDFCVVTSDNPRNERPEDIINEIIPGLDKTSVRYTVLADRRDAISAAISEALPGDVVILAGKGHETYQEFENRRREHFDDKEEALAVLKKVGGV